MNLKRVHIASILIWLLFIIFLFITLEILFRLKFEYALDSLVLSKSPFFEWDKTKIYNKKFVQEKNSYFKNWPIKLETFESESVTPRYLFMPNLRFKFVKEVFVPTQSYGDTFWSSNSLGFRNKEFSVEKSPDRTRIAALGASTTEGTQGDNETYPYYLEKILKLKGHDVEVINAGHHAYVIKDIQAFFEESVLPLDPDILIFYEASNNIAWGEWLTYGNPGDWKSEYSFPVEFLYRYSAFFSYFFDRIISYREFNPKHTFDSLSEKKGLELYKQVVKEIVKTSKNHNIQPILMSFVSVANKDLRLSSSQYPRIWKDLNHNWYPFSYEEVNLIYSRYNDSLKEIAQEDEVPFFDLAAIFPKEPKYFYDHIHFMPEANKILANYLANYLESVALPNLKDQFQFDN